MHSCIQLKEMNKIHALGALLLFFCILFHKKTFAFIVAVGTAMSEFAHEVRTLGFGECNKYLLSYSLSSPGIISLYNTPIHNPSLNGILKLFVDLSSSRDLLVITQYVASIVVYLYG
jgi:hypothetical protein